MATHFVSPSGLFSADGLSEANPWPPARLAHYTPQPGDVIRLAGNATYELALEWFGVGDPERPITLSTYGSGRATIVSGPRDGLNYAGPGGLHIRGPLDFTPGPGAAESGSGVALNGDIDGREARNLVVEGISARGYRLAGIQLSANTLVRDVVIRGCTLSENANGLFTSGAVDGVNMIDNLRVEDTEANDNNLLNPVSQGNGLCIVGADNVAVVGCRAFRNGLGLGQGHSAITLQQCRGFRVSFCYTGGSGHGGHGDGQGVVTNDSQDGVIEHNTSTGDHVGISVHSDLIPGYPSRRILVRDNRITGAVIGLQIYRTRSDVWIVGNSVEIHAQRGEHRKCVDIWDAIGPVFLERNTLRASGDALLLEADGDTGLRNVTLGRSNSWLADSPVWKVRQSYYGRLEDVLAAVPVV